MYSFCSLFFVWRARVSLLVIVPLLAAALCWSATLSCRSLTLLSRLCRFGLLRLFDGSCYPVGKFQLHSSDNQVLSHCVSAEHVSTILIPFVFGWGPTNVSYHVCMRSETYSQYIFLPRLRFHMRDTRYHTLFPPFDSFLSHRFGILSNRFVRIALVGTDLNVVVVVSTMFRLVLRFSCLFPISWQLIGALSRVWNWELEEQRVLLSPRCFGTIPFS